MGWLSKPKAPDYGPLAAAQKEASELQHTASMEALDAWKGRQSQNRQDLMPFREHGLSFLEEIGTGFKEGRWDAEEWEGGLDLPEWAGGHKLPEWQGAGFKVPEWQGGGTQLPDWAGGTDLPDWDPSSVNLEADPGYQFRLAEGEKAIRRSASAGSGAATGATYKALQRYSQDVASDEYAAARERAVEDYQMGRQNVVDERQFAERDYEISLNKVLTNRQLEERDYEILRQNAMTNQEAMSEDYKKSLQKVLMRRELDESDHRILSEGAIAQRNASVQDWQIRNQSMNEEFSRLNSQVGMGFDATTAMVGSGNQTTAQMAEAMRSGAAAQAAGKIGVANVGVQQGIANQQAQQQGFQNLMELVGLGAGIATGFA